MRSIYFTQYMRPSGAKKSNSIERPDDIADMADALVKIGMTFSIEVLSTGVIAMYCEDPCDEDTSYMRLCDNGPEVLEAVDELIREAYQCEITNKEKA